MPTTTRSTRPHWMPRGRRLLITLTDEQLNYMLPVFSMAGHGAEVDGVLRHGHDISGCANAIKNFLRRFKYSDIDTSNIEAALW